MRVVPKTVLPSSHVPSGEIMLIRRIFAILAVAVLLWAPVSHAQSVTGTVARVVDGDTVDVRVDGKVERIRIIGLDTPETVDPRKAVQCFGREASARAKELLPLGTAVTLESDPTQDARDRYGRMLAHVFIHLDAETDVSFALQMIAEGFAHHYVYRVPSIYAADYGYAQLNAMVNWRGLWSPDTCAGQAYPKHDLEDPVPGDPAAQVAGSSGDAAVAAPTSPIPTPAPASPNTFDPGSYVGKGDWFNCSAFRNQAQAQAVLRADPSDPNNLDTDRDGIACEALPEPKDLSRVQRPATKASAAPTTVTAGPGAFDPGFYVGKGDAFNCKAFSSQAQAQAVLRADPRDPNRLDADRDGIACESNRGPKDMMPVKR